VLARRKKPTQRRKGAKIFWLLLVENELNSLRLCGLCAFALKNV
jgi:hypothetical protein